MNYPDYYPGLHITARITLTAGVQLQENNFCNPNYICISHTNYQLHLCSHGAACLHNVQQMVMNIKISILKCQPLICA